MKPFVWVALNLIGFAILIFTYRNTKKSREKGDFGRDLFRYLQVTIMLYLILDTALFLINGKVFPAARNLHYVLYTAYYLVNPGVGLLYFLYCDYKIFADKAALLRRLRFYAIPAIVNAVIVLLSPLMSLVFFIDENNFYHRGNLFWLSLLVAFGYVLASYPLLAVKTRGKKAISPKGQDNYLYLFPIPPVILAVIQLILLGPLLLGMGFAIAVYFIFTNTIYVSDSSHRLSMRFRNLFILQFGVVSFIMAIAILWPLDNLMRNDSTRVWTYIVIILFILSAFGSSLITQHLIFTPLAHLIDSLVRMKKNNEHDIYGLERNDEIGILSNTIQDLFIKGHYDGLTGIYNRRYLEISLKQIMATLARSASKLSVIMADVDYFKKYNDAYGHNKGDECLKAIANTLNESIKRNGDFVARYGGEEFVVVLPGTDEEGVCIIADKMLDAIRKLKMPHEDSYFGIVTISLGVVTGASAASKNDPYEFINMADEALYMSKNSGRNKCTYLALADDGVRKSS